MALGRTLIIKAIGDGGKVLKTVTAPSTDEFGAPVVLCKEWLERGFREAHGLSGKFTVVVERD